MRKSLWERRYEKYVERKMLWERRCEKDVVKKRRCAKRKKSVVIKGCEKNVVRKTLRKTTLWERHRKKDVVRKKTLFDIPSMDTFDLQIEFPMFLKCSTIVAVAEDLISFTDLLVCKHSYLVRATF